MDQSNIEKKIRKRIRKEKMKQIRREEKAAARLAAGRRSSAGSGKKRGSSLMITFLLVFILCTLGFVGVRKAMGEISGYNPFDKGKTKQEKKEEQLVLDTLIDPESPLYETYKNAKKVNILLLGVNQNLTDTIMVVCFDLEYKRADVISIPRDTFYERSPYDSPAAKKINAAYQKDPLNTVKAVSDVLLGMPINYYAVVEYDGVKNIVDSMGGVPMNIPFHMVYNDPYDKPPLRINLPAGEQVLDGEKAVQFLRYRHGYPEGDLGRVKAQQQFVKNAFKQSIGLDLPKIAKTVFENVDSNITLGTTVKLAGKGLGMDSDSLETHTLPHTLEPLPPYYVYADNEGIKEMISLIYAPPAPKTSEGAISGSAVTDSAASAGGKTGEKKKK